jgi:DNA-binding transcriptional regulator GbsR (MarR family)
MNDSRINSVEKSQIMEQIAEMSKLLGMIPSDGSVKINDPVTRVSMELSEWFETTRQSYFKLSVRVGKALELNL